MNKHFEALLKADHDIMEEARVNTFVQFVPANEIQFIGTETERIGKMLLIPSDPTQSQFLNKALPDIQAGIKVSRLSVITKASSGERQYIPTDKVELKVEPANDVSDIQVTDHRNGNYELSFVPRVPGHHQGENIAGSPVEMNVKKRILKRMCVYNMPGRGESLSCGVAVSKEGDIAVSDWKNHCIVMFDKTGHFLRKLSRFGNNQGELQIPHGIAFNSRDELVVADYGNNRIQVLDERSGRVIRTFGRKVELNCPSLVYVDDRDRVFVSCQLDFFQGVKVFDKGGKFVFEFGNESGKPNVFLNCASYQDSFIVSELLCHVTKVFDNEGRFLYKFGRRRNKDGEFDSPRGLVVDGHGNLLVCDSNNNRVQMFTMD